MARRATTLLKAARLGSRAVRTLIRPVRPGEAGGDPWLAAGDPRRRWRSGVGAARRGAGVVVLLVLAALGALVLLPLILLLGAGTAFGGSEVAGWLLGLTLLLGVIGAVWTGRRALTLLRAPPEVPAADLPEEGELLTVWRGAERALPPRIHGALQATVLATRDAIRVTAHDQTLSRDAFDARQAAREELPELIAAYRALPDPANGERELLSSLEVLRERMETVSAERSGERQRVLGAHGKYLREKYAPEAAEPDERG
ncbi:hypothetical protein SAMN04488058_11632 [Deinococcus reticulitermitis]|uniref:Uncharacterized protein n=1 Tax=Deinococcus reticulitermitis TaxID=856736 RepID=A0A1H7BFU4_9DEIO|nr:hypothetical protein [Deinococcus reticulitermitis]SEJ73100.1 hypothetical protein SAMN04488058_11632 [Deinococcus reticulitermitis]